MSEYKTEHRKYEPYTEFGKAVAESGFSRVCIECGRKWSDRAKWVEDTAFIGTQRTDAGVLAVRACSCGNGEMLADVKSTNGLKPGPTVRPPWLYEADKKRRAERVATKSLILRKRLDAKNRRLPS
jgi:hypothetical protein